MITGLNRETLRSYRLMSKTFIALDGLPIQYNSGNKPDWWHGDFRISDAIALCLINDSVIREMRKEYEFSIDNRLLPGMNLEVRMFYHVRLMPLTMPDLNTARHFQYENEFETIFLAYKWFIEETVSPKEGLNK